MQFSLFATSVFAAGKNREWRTSLEGTVLMRPDGHGMRVVLAFLVFCVCRNASCSCFSRFVCVCVESAVYMFFMRTSAHVTVCLIWFTSVDHHTLPPGSYLDLNLLKSASGLLKTMGYEKEFDASFYPDANETELVLAGRI
jgi:hypothetical protein